MWQEFLIFIQAGLLKRHTVKTNIIVQNFFILVIFPLNENRFLCHFRDLSPGPRPYGHFLNLKALLSSSTFLNILIYNKLGIDFSKSFRMFIQFHRLISIQNSHEKFLHKHKTTKSNNTQSYLIHHDQVGFIPRIPL